MHNNNMSRDENKYHEQISPWVKINHLTVFLTKQYPINTIDRSHSHGKSFVLVIICPKSFIQQSNLHKTKQ